MAEETTPAKKPAAKKPAARKPATRKPAARKPAAKKPEDLSREELLALLAKQDEKNPEPAGSKEAVEWVAPPQAKTAEEAAGTPRLAETAPTVSTTLFIRNLRGTPVSYRLARQEGKRRTDLKPRGQRGDIVKLEEGDLEDPGIVDAVAYGLVEIITSSEASSAIQKQSVNQQQAVHPAFAHIRNELDKPYAPGSVSTEAEGGGTGFVVGQVATPDPQFGNKAVTATRDIVTRGDAPAPAGVSQLNVPVQAGEEANLAARDALARAAKQPNGPLEALGLTLSVNPTQQS